jgi:hypothetical protein
MRARVGLVVLSVAMAIGVTPIGSAQVSKFSKPAVQTPAPNPPPPGSDRPPPESALEFNSGQSSVANGLTPVTKDDPPKLSEGFKFSRAVAFSLGASVGFASYHAGDVNELLDHPLSDVDRLERLVNGDHALSIELMCKSVDTAREILKREMARAIKAGFYPSSLKAPADCDPVALRNATKDKATHHINRDYYTGLIATRETWNAQLQKEDPLLAASLRAGINVSIAEGFASRSSDATAIVASALKNAWSDVLALGLDSRRLQEAIDYAKPGANMKVLHDMVMSMRMSFEATL